MYKMYVVRRGALLHVFFLNDNRWTFCTFGQEDRSAELRSRMSQWHMLLLQYLHRLVMKKKKKRENLGFWTTAPLKNTNSLWPNSSRSVC